jgi:outer membrane autotransporter protein
VGDQTASALDLAGQVQVSRAFNVKITGPGNKLIPALGVGVLHQFALNDESIDASFGGGTPFVLPGEKFEQTLALVGAGVTLTMNHGMAAYARYNAELNGDYTAQTVLAGLQFGF